MLLDLSQTEYQHWAAPFARQVVPLHAMLNSCGYMRETSTAYDWRGRKRGNGPFGLIQYTTAGFGMIEQGGVTHTITPGMAMVLHFPADNRYWLPPHSEGWEFLYAVVHGNEIMRLWHEVTSRTGPALTLPENSPVITTLRRTVLDAISGRITSPFSASARAYELAMVLLDHVSLPPPAEQHPTFIRDALTFCREQYLEQIGVDDIARVAGCSRYHLSRLFKAWVGTPPAAYVSQLRLRESIRLLAQPSLSVKEVADQSGFADYNYFCRVFRRHFGISPGSYKTRGRR